MVLQSLASMNESLEKVWPIGAAYNGRISKNGKTEIAYYGNGYGISRSCVTGLDIPLNGGSYETPYVILGVGDYYGDETGSGRGCGYSVSQGNFFTARQSGFGHGFCNGGAGRGTVGIKK